MQKSKQNPSAGSRLDNKEKQIKILERALKTKLSKNEYIRIQAVLLRKKGYSHKQIIEIVSKSKEALKNWITNFHQKGLSGLKDQPITKPRNYKLTKEQKEEIKAVLNGQKPAGLGFQGEFWTPQILKQLVKQKFNVTYQSNNTYRELFKFCGFSY